MFMSEELDPQSAIGSTAHLPVGVCSLYRSSRSHFITSRVRSNRTSGQTITVHQHKNQNIKFTNYSEASNGQRSASDIVGAGNSVPVELKDTRI